MIYLLTGQPGSGKTTLARALQARGVVDVVLDGDDLRALDDPGYDRAGRERNVDRAHAIARYLEHQGQRVAVALVQPYAWQRDAMTQAGAIEVYMVRHHGVREHYHVEGYEPPTSPAFVSPEVEDVVAWTQRPRAMFIGRYQTFHDGHRWLISQALDRGDPVLVAVRDTDEPRDAHEIAREIRAEYRGRDVRVIVIPDIASVEYGRDVGYDVIEHTPPQEIRDVNGTAIREAAHVRP